jgi:hypothetical protein
MILQTGVFKTSPPVSLGESPLVIALEADLVSSSAGVESATSTSAQYSDSLKQFQGKFEQAIEQAAAFTINHKIGESGDDCQVVLLSAWSDLAVASALRLALAMDHQCSGITCYSGIRASITADANLDTAKRLAARIVNCKDALCGSEHAGVLLHHDAYSVLSPFLQRAFEFAGEHQVGRNATEKVGLYRLQESSRNGLRQALDEFFATGLIGVLEDGLCPGANDDGPGDLALLEYLIRHARKLVSILQTYSPQVEDLKGMLSGNQDLASIRVLLLNPELKSNCPYAAYLTDSGIEKLRPDLCSPLAFQRGVDFDLSPPQRFKGFIEHCQGELSKLKNAEVKTYDATPSVCLHIIDDLMFVSFFLQSAYAVSTPALVLVRGSTLFGSFEKEFEIIWKRSQP